MILFFVDLYLLINLSMKNRFLVLLLILFSLNISFACAGNVEIENVPVTHDKDEDSYDDIREWFDYLCSKELGGRYSGSEGIKKAFTYITGVIGNTDSLEVDSFDTDKCQMKNIIFHIPGECDSLIVIGAHYDAFGYWYNSPAPGADDNMSGVAVLLRLIKLFQKQPVKLSYCIDVCLFDGEEIGRYGSKRYMNQNNNDIKKFINVDTCGNKNFGIGFYYDKSYPVLKEEFDRFKEVIDGYKVVVDCYNPIGYTTDCEPFEKMHIPFVSIQNDTPSDYLHTFNDNVCNISFKRLTLLSNSLYQYLLLL